MHPDPKKALEALWELMPICLQGFFNTSGSSQTGNTNIARERSNRWINSSFRTGDTRGTVMVFDETTGYLHQHYFYFSSINQSDDLIILPETTCSARQQGWITEKYISLFQQCE